MLCLSGFELYSRWVPLFYYPFKIILSLKQAKTCLRPWMLSLSSIACLLASLGDKGLFRSANQYSSNSRCRLSSSVFMLFSVLPF